MVRPRASVKQNDDFCYPLSRRGKVGRSWRTRVTTRDGYAPNVPQSSSFLYIRLGSLLERRAHMHRRNPEWFRSAPRDERVLCSRGRTLVSQVVAGEN